MNYIWETVLAAKKSGIGEKELHFLEAENPSPYMEVSFCDLNIASIEEYSIEVNPLYRFTEIFAEILGPDVEGYSKTKELFLDVLLHYLAHTDLRMGLHKQEFCFRFLLEEMKDGMFGNRAGNVMKWYQGREQKLIVTAMADLYQSGNYLPIFIHLMEKLYENSLVYVSQDRANEVLIYAGVMETEEEREKIGFLTDTFLPLGWEVKIFFSEHFGILDVQETMVLDRILLF